MKIRVVREENEFLALKSDWDRLANELVAVTKFDWAYKWWNHFKGKNELNILVAETDGRIIGIAPLYIENTKALKFIPFRKLRFLGGDLTDFVDFLVEQRYQRELIFRHLLDYALNGLDYDFVDFGQINSDYPNFDLWQIYAECTSSKFNIHRENHKIKLSDFGSYEAYMHQLSKNNKRNMRYRINKIVKDRINLEYVFKSNITEEDIEIISKINLKRQKFLHEKGDQKRFCYFLNQQKLKFIKDYFCSNNLDTKMLAYIKFNDVIVAYDLILLSENTFSLWNGAFDSDYEIYSPSKFLLTELIRYAFEREYEYFDFMRGSDSYKLKWTNRRAFNYSFEHKKSLKSKQVFSYRENIPEFILKKLRSPSSEILRA
ncbi:MAG: hypothetical protein ACD_20C00429G0004 [uncultured bacterium]|nr:MAG: hypothetical protein ACD_20C00429G0004 [uncultured bacterium]HBH17952.1 hypothetical protein [Cyanobacteria bacterium UBA9579]